MYVARAVRKYSRRRDSNNEHRPGVLRAQKIILAHLSCAVYADSLGVLEVQEQQPNMGIDQNVAPGSVHAVTVVIRNSKGAIVQDAHEPG